MHHTISTPATVVPAMQKQYYQFGLVISTLDTSIGTVIFASVDSIMFHCVNKYHYETVCSYCVIVIVADQCTLYEV